VEFKNSFNATNLKAQFDLALQSSENSKIYIETVNEEYWNFYFQSGSLIWATYSKHRLRRLYRIINKYCPEVNCQQIQLREKEISELWGYLMLVVIYKRDRVTIENLQAIITEIAQEVLFDLFQSLPQVKKIEYVAESSQHSMRAILKSILLKKPLVQLKAETIYRNAEANWEAWLKADLAAYSPNMALVIRDDESLENATNSNTYLKLAFLVDGKKTLRDLAVATKQESSALLRSFLSYIESGYLGIKEVEDEYLAIHNSVVSRIQPIEPLTTTSDRPREIVCEQQYLVACIDDNLNVCREMCNIVNSIGYRFVSIGEPIQALSTLLDQKPDLIFLNLVMPMTNGYEICSQIRRISFFKETPIIILTANDGIIDLVRAKMAGASDFISKPVEKDKIVCIIHKYANKDRDSNLTDTSVVKQKA
jgi:two-component system, chemotaxis family, response regulator PixG